MSMAADSTYAVSPARLAYGVWDHESEVERGEGDICASYSGDCIATAGTVRKPFVYQGSLWVSVGGSFHHKGSAKCYRLLPVRLFDGKPTTYSLKVNSNPLDETYKYPGDTARNDPMGFYHGMAVKHGREMLVLVGPEALFAPDAGAVTASQLSLF